MVEDCEAEPEPDAYGEESVGIHAVSKSPMDRLADVLEGTPDHTNGSWNGADGSMYEGQMYCQMKQGRGTMMHADGTVYVGTWQDDAKDGSGIEVWADGTKYDGDFFRGQKHGHGVYTSPDGSHYSGQFRNDCMEGNGRYRFVDGRVYTGQWQENSMFGQGTMENGNSFYEGGYEGGCRNGFGTFGFPDGRRYSGQWEGGKLQGLGIYTDQHGRNISVEWQPGGTYRPLATPAFPDADPDSELDYGFGEPPQKWAVIAPLNVRSRPNSHSGIIDTKDVGEIVEGHIAGDCLKLSQKAGFIAFSSHGRQLLVPADQEIVMDLRF